MCMHTRNGTCTYKHVDLVLCTECALCTLSVHAYFHCSPQDVLTDLSITLETIKVEHAPYDKLNTLVHKVGQPNTSTSAMSAPRCPLRGRPVSACRCFTMVLLLISSISLQVYCGLSVENAMHGDTSPFKLPFPCFDD